MHENLEQQLLQKYAHLFRGKELPVTENLMAFGCECGDGWYGLIAAACSEIATHQNICGSSDFLWLQIKEKFGALRLYYSGGDEYIAGVVAVIEKLSERTCEICGAPASRPETPSGGWIVTRCENCSRAAGKKAPTGELSAEDVFQNAKLQRLEFLNISLRHELVAAQQEVRAMRTELAALEQLRKM